MKQNEKIEQLSTSLEAEHGPLGFVAAVHTVQGVKVYGIIVHHKANPAWWPISRICRADARLAQLRLNEHDMRHVDSGVDQQS